MEENREQILADFQSCTGVDDVGECIMHLEAANWNLLDAIHTVMPEETQTLPSERNMGSSPMEIVEEVNVLPSPMDVVSIVSGGDTPLVNHDKASSAEIIPADEVTCLTGEPSFPPTPRILNFSVRYKGTIIPLEIPDSETIGSIKSALYSELGVPSCRQELIGWPRNRVTDDIVLSSLPLQQLTNLLLSAEGGVNFSSDPGADKLSLTDHLNMTYQLHIIDTTNSKEYDLCFPGTKSVLEVKLGVQDITSIPVRFQRWVGWPETAKEDKMTLGAIGIKGSTLELILHREERPPKSKKQLVVDLSSSESSENEFEDAAECFGVDDDMFHAASSSKKIQPLMPESTNDERSAVCHFEREFANRYGECHPSFFQGSFSEALQSSCQRPAKDRRPLAIYLHHDSSVLTNVFCTQLLCSETVVTYLTLNFITWAWDITHDSNKASLLGTFSQNFGVGAASTIRNIPLDHLPALMVITKVRSTAEVLTVIPGNVGLDELMTRLIHAVEVFNNEISTEIWEEEEREAREQVKREQDAAYEASLMADRAKEEARRQEEEQRKEQEMNEQKEKEEKELLRLQEEEVKEAIRKSLAEQLPPEPEEDCDAPISHIRVRLPSGVTIARRFLASDPLERLLTFIGSQGFPITEYKVLANWPRRDLTSLDSSSTLEQLKLYPKETLTLEER